MTALRLALRIHRFEVLGLGVFALAALAFSGGLLLRLLAFDLPASCFLSGPEFDPACGARTAAVNDYSNLVGNFTPYAFAGIALLPLLGGLVLGVALVGKEIDHGTAVLAWSLAPSRWRWLLGRAVPVGLLVIGTCLVGGFIANGLEAARSPDVDPAQSLQDPWFRGAVVGAEGLAAFGVALAVGARLGRILPALLLSGGLVFGTAVGTALVTDAMLTTETVAVDSSAMMSVHAFGAGKVFDMLIRTPDGELLGWEEAHRRYGDVIDPGLPGYDPAFGQAYVVNPGALHPIVEARMSVILGAVGLMGVVLAFAIVDRRRPT